MKTRFLVPALLLPIALTACPKDKTQPLTLSEASQALDQASASSQAEALASDSVEIATNFTIGEAVENAAAELRDFIQTQLPCADITLSKATLDVKYGVNPGNCTWHGQTYTGESSVTIARDDSGDVQVHHEWTGLSNGKVSVTGKADVTWSSSDKSRHVVHDLKWTRLSDNMTGEGTGDRTQVPLSGGVIEGIEVNGSRSWTGPKGTWDLAIDGVQMRWEDPVPQSGSYTLGTPFNKSMSLTFSRVDADTIRCTVASGGREFHFDVTKLGATPAN